LGRVDLFVGLIVTQKLLFCLFVCLFGCHVITPFYKYLLLNNSSTYKDTSIHFFKKYSHIKHI
jgi:hypothetical protein